MKMLVWIGEWRLAESRLALHVGDHVNWRARLVGTEDLDWFASIVPAASGRALYEIDDTGFEPVVSIHGRVTAIDVLRARYPSPRGGSPLRSSGVVEWVRAAGSGLNERIGDGRRVMGWFVEVVVATSATSG